jgi:hypothetical protein
MKNKKVFVLGLLILALIFAIGVTACGGNNGNDNNDGNGDGNGNNNGGNNNNGNGNNGGYYLVSSNVCEGVYCRVDASNSRAKFSGEAGQEWDNAIWESWSGGYHEKMPFSSCGSTYTVDVNGKKWAPHFTDADRMAAEAAASQVLGL